MCCKFYKAKLSFSLTQNGKWTLEQEDLNSNLTSHKVATATSGSTDSFGNIYQKWHGPLWKRVQQRATKINWDLVRIIYEKMLKKSKVI